MTNEKRTINEWLATLSPIAAAVAAVAAAYITYRISPFAASLSLINQRVTAVENNYANRGTVETGFTHIKNEFDRVNQKLDRIEDRLNK